MNGRYRYGELSFYALKPSSPNLDLYQPVLIRLLHLLESLHSLCFIAILKELFAVMAFPERPSFYPMMSMPCVNPSNVLRNTDRPVVRNRPPPFPQQPYPPPPHNMPNPFTPPSPNGARFPPPPPPPPFNMQHNITAPIPIKPSSPSHMQDPFTPPPSAPPTPVPVLELNQQNEILTQRWNWLPSMFCSIVDDSTGDVYKIITITWDGSCKDCYLKRVGEGGILEEKGKDVFEKELIPAGRRDQPPPPPPCELTPPSSERGFSPPPFEPRPNQGAPVMVINHNGGPGPAYGNAFPPPRPAFGEEYHSEEDEEDNSYEAKPPLSPAMAARGFFPADEEYHASQSQGYSSDDYWGGEPEYHGGGDDPGFISIRQPDREPKKSSSGKKQHKKRHHSESSKERSLEKGSKKSSSKSRGHRSSTSLKSDDEKKEKKGSSHRGRRGSKPGLFW